MEGNLEKANHLTELKVDFSVIIEGKYLEKALLCSSEFLQLGLLASTVICCRVTPHQKAQACCQPKKKLTHCVGGRNGEKLRQNDPSNRRWRK